MKHNKMSLFLKVINIFSSDVHKMEGDGEHPSTYLGTTSMQALHVNLVSPTRI